MPEWLDPIITIFVSVLASSGLWTFFQKRYEKRDSKTQLLIGLAHDRIMYLGMKYIERGWITQDEYENLYDYLFTPYEKMGGNGSAARLMKEVDRLPIRSPFYKEEKK